MPTLGAPVRRHLAVADRAITVWAREADEELVPQDDQVSLIEHMFAL